MGGLNSKHMFLKVLEAGSLRSGCQYGWVLGEGHLAGLQMVVFLLCHHMAKIELTSSLASSYKGTNPIHEGPTLRT